MTNHFGIKNIGFGMGLRTKHFSYILENQPKMDWFEIISENFMNTDGRPRRVLEEISENYPIVMHGVSLSIGSTDPLNMEYLKKLKELAGWVKPRWISDHLCWTGINKTDTHDLLPVPYTKEALKHIVGRIKRVQDYLGRPLILENPSTYLEYKYSQMPEWEFLAELSEQSDCGILLDANNVYVSCYNHGWDEKNYIDSIPKSRVVQIHLAGHENNGTHIVDTHEGPIIDPVWKLYKYIISQFGQISTLIEWDTNIPEFKTVAAEVEKARKFAAKPEKPNDLPSHLKIKVNDNERPKQKKYKATLPDMHGAIISGDVLKAKPAEWIPAKDNFSPAKQLGVYIDGYRHRLFDIISEDFPITRHYLGDKKTNKLISEYVEATPSKNYNLAKYVLKFPNFARKNKVVGRDKAACELIELETALTVVFDWPETKSFDRAALAKIKPEKFYKTRFKPRKALKIYKFQYPVSEYYTAVLKEKNPKKPLKKESYVVVYRHEDEMLRLSLEKAEYIILKEMFENNLTIEKALEKVVNKKVISADKLAEKFQYWLLRWVDNGLLMA